MPGYQCANFWPFIINAPLWLTQVVLVVYGENITFNQRLIPGFSVMAVTMLIIPILCKVGGSTGFYTTDLVLIILGFASGACQGTCYQMAAAFPPEYMSAVMFGNGISGFGSNLLRIATILIWDQDYEKNQFIAALALYIFSFFVLAGCAVAQVCLNKNAYAIYNLNKIGRKNSASNTAEEVMEETGMISGQAATNASALTSRQSAVENKKSLSKYFKQAMVNFKMTDGLLWALMYVFVLTFICYPGLASDDTINFLKSSIDTSSKYNSWHIIFIQLIFNLTDTVGRYSGGVSCLMLSNMVIKLFASARTLFFVTFCLISFDVSPFFGYDWFIILNLILFSITNGYVSTLCAVKAPMSVEGEAKGQVGGFVGITISTGIVLGSMLAFAVTYLIEATPEYKNSQE